MVVWLVFADLEDPAAVRDAANLDGTGSLCVCSMRFRALAPTLIATGFEGHWNVDVSKL